MKRPDGINPRKPARPAERAPQPGNGERAGEVSPISSPGQEPEATSAPVRRPLLRPGTEPTPASEAPTQDLSEVRRPEPGQPAGRKTERPTSPSPSSDQDTLDLSGVRDADVRERAGWGEPEAPSRRSLRQVLRDRSDRAADRAEAAAELRDSEQALDDRAAALTAAETAAADRAAWIDEIAPASAASDYRKAKRSRRRSERAEVRRFTTVGRQRRRNWLIGCGAVLLVAAISALFAFTPILSVRQIEVQGASRVNAEDLAHDLSSQLGSPFPAVDSAAIRDVLVGYPLIESYVVEARPPSTLLIRVVERTPLGVIAAGARFDLVDAAGVVVESSTTQPEGYPLIAVERTRYPAAFTAVGAVLRAMPADLLPRITSITATTRDNVTFTMAGTTSTVLWGDASDGALKARLLEALIKAKPDAKRYDVTSTEIGVVR